MASFKTVETIPVCSRGLPNIMLIKVDALRHCL